jgi:hypothetical protein
LLLRLKLFAPANFFFKITGNKIPLLRYKHVLQHGQHYGWFFFKKIIQLYIMRISKLFQLVFLLVPFLAAAQKLDIDSKRLKTNFIRFPENPVPAEWRTYSIKDDGLYAASSAGLDADMLRSQYLVMHGYEKVEKDGDVVIEAKMSPVRFLDVKINDKKYESKDSKTGKVTTTYKYFYKVTYETGYQAKLYDKAGKVLWDFNKGMGLLRTNTFEHVSEEFSTYKNASDHYGNNRVELQRDLALRCTQTAFNNVRSGINAAYGFMPYAESVNIYTTDTKKHPENNAFNQTYESVKAHLESIPASGITEEAATGLAKACDYYKATAEKYKSDEKADVKLRYACYYNLANIAYALDRPEESIEWANKLIANDYDKKDGKAFIEDAEALMVKLKKHGLTSRRFERASKA